MVAEGTALFVLTIPLRSYRTSRASHEARISSNTRWFVIILSVFHFQDLGVMGPIGVPFFCGAFVNTRPALAWRRAQAHDFFVALRIPDLSSEKLEERWVFIHFVTLWTLIDCLKNHKPVVSNRLSYVVTSDIPYRIKFCIWLPTSPFKECIKFNQNRGVFLMPTLNHGNL